MTETFNGIEYGATPTGFVRMPLDVCLEQVRKEVRDTFGENSDLGDEGPFGQYIGTQANRRALNWELAEAVYASGDPDKAEGAALDAVCALTGTVRLEALPSTVPVVMTGDAGTVLDAGRVASVTGTGARFTSLASVTLVALAERLPITVYAIGDRVFSGTHAYQALTAGATDTPPTLTPGTAENRLVVDDEVTWLWLGEGTAAAEGAWESEDDGPIVAATGGIAVIETPASGWLGVCNIEDAELGRLVETDAALRIRREDELVSSEGGTFESIRNAVKAITGVTSVRIFMNLTAEVDVDGMPARSIEVMVRGGADQAIREVLWQKVGTVLTHGNVTGTVIDSEGNTQTVKFSRATEVPIYIALTVERYIKEFPQDGEAQIKAGVLALGDTSQSGKDAVARALASPAFKVAGVLNVQPCNIGIAPAPGVETTVTIGKRQLATYDSARITVTLTSGEP